MPYEIFTRKIHRSGNPTLSFSKLGQFAFNQSAARILQKDSIELVLLMWDANSNKIGIKSTSNKKDARAYRIRYADKGNGAGFSAKTFLDHVGIDYSDRKSFPVEINPDSEIMIEIKVPDNFFKRKPQPRVFLERGKATAG